MQHWNNAGAQTLRSLLKSSDGKSVVASASLFCQMAAEYLCR